MKYSLLINSVVVATLLSGCSTIKDINAYNKAKMMDDAKASCHEYGFKEGSDKFAACLQTEVNEYKKRKILEMTTRRSTIPYCKVNHH